MTQGRIKVKEEIEKKRKKTMICTEKTLTQKPFLYDCKSNLDSQHQKLRLVACWKKVDGQLICQWIIA